MSAAELDILLDGLVAAFLIFAIVMLATAELIERIKAMGTKGRVYKGDGFVVNETDAL